MKMPTTTTTTTTAAYSAVAPRQVTHCDDDNMANDDDNNNNNNSPETTGIFVIAHSDSTQKCPKRKCKESPRRRNNNMFSSASPPLRHSNNNTLLIIVLATLLATHLTPQQSFATAYQPLPSSLTTSSYYECGSMDIRNKCDNFVSLENCTVITGFLIIVLVPANNLCDYSQIRFPKLREITDFVLVHEVKNFTTFKYMFPNLTVIRGRRLFLNYAIGITRMNQLATLEFPSLIAIQRGHVLVSNNEKLCSLDNISFDRMTLTPGQNHVARAKKLVCPVTPKCLGCDSGYCWSNRVCQKFENDNIVNLQQGIQHCDAQCLGGCYNRTAQGCAVCHSWTDHGTCVEKCDPDKYVSEHYMRCYTREECVSKRLLIYKKTCVSVCPAGYKINRVTHECDSCGGVNSCPTICYSHSLSDPFVLSTLGEFEKLRGCQILNASVIINVINRINDQELKGIFKDLREIVGYLRIEGSHYLTSLSFLENLQKIHGKILEDSIYGIVLYNNRNIKELWSPKTSLELLQGGMYIHSQDRLCNRVVKKFKNTVKHDNGLDSIQTSDQEVLCAPAKLNVAVEDLSHRSFKLVWPMDQTYEEVEIIHRPVTDGVPLTEHSEQETRVCERVNWIRDLKFAVELQHNASHYYYMVDELNPNTKYASLVKTFGQDEDHEIRSELLYATTHIDIPTPPMIRIAKKSFDSLAIQLYYENREDQFVDFYRMEIYELEDKKEILDQRNYCEDPMNSYTPEDHRNEDYDTCCSHQLEEEEDAWFKKKLRQEFACTLDKQQLCESNSLDENVNEDAFLTKRLEHSEMTYVVRSLKRFHRYVIQVQACNRKGCGSFNIISERTNFSLAADKLYDLNACRIPKSNEYRVHFKEPSQPNGLIAAYALHFRYFDSSSQGPYLSHTHCLSRLEHERQNYLYLAHMNATYNQAAVRVDSLGHHLFTDWVDITKCSGLQPNTKVAGTASPSWDNFIIFLVGGIMATLIYVCYKREYWRQIPQCRRYIYMIWYQLTPAIEMPEDRQVLTQAFEPSVHFQNTPEEDEQHQLVVTTRQSRERQ